MTSHIIEADQIRVERGGSVILNDVSFVVPRDSEILIQGPSGAGKTTLFEILGLLANPTAGSLIIGGTDTATLSERQRARIRRDMVGIIFQDFQLIPDLTGWENAALPQEHVGSRDEAWLETLFSRLGIQSLVNQYPASLSGGERQRIAIARALANRPAVVLADEPTGQLDPETTDHVLDLLFEVQNTANTALVVVSHDRSLADRFNHTVRIENGTVV